MKSATKIVETYVKKHPYLEEALRLGLINQSALAQHIGKQQGNYHLKTPSLVAAVRRYQDKVKENTFSDTQYGNDAQALLRTKMTMLTYQKTPSLISMMSELSNTLLNDAQSPSYFVYGEKYCSIICELSSLEFIKESLKKEKLYRTDSDMAVLSLRYIENLASIPGNLFKLTRALAWSNISIYNLIESVGESIFIIKEEQANEALQCINKVIQRDTIS